MSIGKKANKINQRKRQKLAQQILAGELEAGARGLAEIYRKAGLSGFADLLEAAANGGESAKKFAIGHAKVLLEE